MWRTDTARWQRPRYGERRAGENSIESATIRTPLFYSPLSSDSKIYVSTFPLIPVDNSHSRRIVYASGLIERRALASSLKVTRDHRKVRRHGLISTYRLPFLMINRAYCWKMLVLSRERASWERLSLPWFGTVDPQKTGSCSHVQSSYHAKFGRCGSDVCVRVVRPHKWLL